jgi:Rrf2 family nitric oxide-sensitive transcriptional repressor
MSRYTIRVKKMAVILSQTAEYALRAVVWLAGHLDQPQTAQQIAGATGVPPGYLAKIMRLLGRAGVVSARRGIGGGFALAKVPTEMTALDVVSAVDRIERIEKCPLGWHEHKKRLCPLHQRINGAIELVEEAFRESTIAELGGSSRRRARKPTNDDVPGGISNSWGWRHSRFAAGFGSGPHDGRSIQRSKRARRRL